MTARIATLGFGASSSVAGGAAGDLVGGKELSGWDATWNAATGAGGTLSPGGQSSSSSLNHLTVNNVRTFDGIFSGTANAVRLRTSVAVGGVTSIATDTLHEALEVRGLWPG